MSDLREDLVFGVGLPRTGTASLAKATGGVHEADNAFVLKMLRETEVTRAKVVGEIRAYFCGVTNPIRIGHPLGELIPFLVEAFPAAKFILTTRHPVTWLASYRERWQGAEPHPDWAWLHRQYWGYMPATESYFHFWCERHERVLSQIPTERLAIVPVEEFAIVGRATADWAGIPWMTGCHENRGDPGLRALGDDLIASAICARTFERLRENGVHY